MLKKKKLPSLNVDFDDIKFFLEEYGGNHLSHLILLNDKRVYMTENKQAIIVFQKIGKRFIVLGDPIGNEDCLVDAIKEFEKYSRSLGCTPIYYQVSSALLAHYHEMGYRFFKLGEEAIVQLTDFNIDGKQGARLRTRRNKFIKQGYQFNVLMPPYSDELLKSLRRVSDSWLSNRKEKCFSVSFFCEEYISHFPVAVLQDKDGNIIAFATLASDDNGEMNTISIDLMRHISDKPHGTMDVLFVSILFWAKENGFVKCSLGMAPLANVGTHSDSFRTEKLAHYVFKYGNTFYKFQGLLDYKSKFAHSWEPKYLAYKKSLFMVVILKLYFLVHRKSFNLDALTEKMKRKKNVIS